MKAHRHLLLGALLLLALNFLIYAQTLQHSFAPIDDAGYVAQNPRIEAGLTPDNIHWAFTTYLVGNWHPVTLLSYLLDGQIYGYNPAGYHLTNLLLHAANSLLVLLVLHHLTGDLWRPLLLALLWTVHPLRVESVAWIAERKDVLSAFFFLLALIPWSRYAATRRPAHYLLALLLFALAVLAKPMLVTGPCLLLLLDFWPLRRITPDTLLRLPPAPATWRLLAEKIPFLLLSALVCLLTILAQDHAINSTIPPAIRLSNALASYWSYLALTLWPQELILIYPYPRHPPGLLLTLASALALLAVTLLALRHLRRHPALLVGWLWWLGSLVPVIGLIQVGAQPYADRYTYLPHLGLFLAILWPAADLTRSSPLLRNFLLLLLALALPALTLHAWQRAAEWSDPLQLIETSALLAPPHPRTSERMAQRYLDLGDPIRATQFYARALSVEPENPDTLARYGALLHQRRQDTRALQPLLLSARLRPDDPDTLLVLSDTLLSLHDPLRAEGAIIRHLHLRPDNPVALQLRQKIRSTYNSPFPEN